MLGLLAATIAPVTLALVNTNWLFTPAPFLDPFQYVGLFLNYDETDFLPQHYRLARLPWVLSGYLVHRVFIPETASLVLHGGYLALAIAAVYLAIWIAFRDVAVALFVAVAIGFFPPFHGSGGWDYHNTAAGAFYLVTIALLHAAIWLPRLRSVMLFGVGLALALTVHSNIVFINLVPLSVVFFVMLVSVGEGWRVAGRSALVGAMWVTAGGFLVTAMLCVVSFLSGRDLLFFWPLVEIVLRYVSAPEHQKQWWIPLSQLWKAEMAYLSIPAAVGVASVVALLVPPAEVDDDRCRRVAPILLVGQFWAACVLWVAWQALGHTALVPDYFAYPLFPLCFMALAGILRRYGRWSSGRGGLFLGVVSAMIFWLALAGEVGGRVLRSWPGLSHATFLPAFVLALMGLLAFIRLRGSLVGALACAILLAGANASSYSGSVRPHDYAWTDPCRLRNDVFRTIVDAAKFIWEVDPAFDAARVWFPENAFVRTGRDCVVPVGHIGYSITATAGAGSYLTRPWPMPAIEELPEVALRRFATISDVVIVVTNDRQDVNRMQSRASNFDVSLELFKEANIRSGEAAFSIYALRGLKSHEPPGKWRPGDELVELEGNQLRGAWQLHVYGWPRKGRLLETSRGLIAFRSTTRQDHLALPFVELPSGVQWAVLEASADEIGDSPEACRLFVQNQAFVILGDAPCPDQRNLTVRASIMIPSDTQRVRVYIANTRAWQTSIVPSRVRLVTLVDDAGGRP